MTCEYCHTLPHLPGCPAAPEPKASHRCKRCGDGIVEGEGFCDIDGVFYHLECLEEMGLIKILKLLGIEIETA